MIQAVVTGSQEKGLMYLMRYCVQVVVYAIWHERNVRRVRESCQPAACLSVRLDKMVRNRITSLRRKPGGKHEKTMIIWLGRSSRRSSSSFFCSFISFVIEMLYIL